jgi:predicted nucleic acid-binding protein
MADRNRFHHVLDTSAVIAYLAGESGAAQVQTLKPAAAIPFMVYSELYYLIWQRKSKTEADNTYGLVKSWRLPLLLPNERIILTAGRLKAQYRLGIADSYIAAFALLKRVPLVSKDPDYEVLSSEMKLIKLP